MMFRKKNRFAVASLGVASLVALAACSNGGATPGEPTAGGTDSASSADCAAYESYGDLSGKTVTVYASIVSPEDQPQIDSYKPFEKCTGATIAYEGSREFEAQLPVKIEAGSPPDIAYIPQPGLLKTLVDRFPDAVKPVAAAADANVDKYYNEAWKGYGTVDGKYYAVPVGANAKSFVWYSPSLMSDGGYEIPTTLDELMALTEKIATEHPDAKPWCAGIESGAATGWPATDWLEDMMLRTVTPEEYDKWVNHEMPFNDPKVVEALDMAGAILKNDKYVNGGYGNVKTIATTAFGDAGLPILDGQCYMHRQASFYQANWPEGTKIAEDGDVFAFYLPGKDADVKPLLGGGEFATAFADRPEVQAFQAYLTSPEWSNEKAKASPAGWLSANKELDPANLKSPIDQLAFKLLSDEKTVFRFDGSDLMPGAVGSGSFWKGMTDWIALDKSSKDVLDTIEASWPKS
ncbi:ABC transporter substrate-binding protein [Tessaracoccus antarcticus]|uniref:Carbohydrate ABC transporter substrate-binding protein n=1 Tax=Tessaracoccus antarcticus TaxID=2479848 RepID=A0A3M0G4S4_9ACTN|nr:ABC transporter substrate-binding protein [Tessaracoccus antarcticus]RMB60021.1 carbohydrate ABC transporter substrate-binding protein [Tessaracoccus antarcticus]